MVNSSIELVTQIESRTHYSSAFFVIILRYCALFIKQELVKLERLGKNTQVQRFHASASTTITQNKRGKTTQEYRQITRLGVICNFTRQIMGKPSCVQSGLVPSETSSSGSPPAPTVSVHRRRNCPVRAFKIQFSGKALSQNDYR